MLFVLLYEPTKFFLFGERFLSESFIVYPLVYLFGLALEKINGLKLNSKDLVLSSIFAWFVIFMREPYIPLGIFFFAFILWDKNLKKIDKKAVGIFTLLSLITLATLPLKDYLLQVFILNASNSDAQTLFSLRGISGFFYPFLILISGKVNLYRLILVGLDLAFLYSLFVILKNKMFDKALLIFTVLGLANLRFVTPGTQFYEAFHLIQWFGLFLFAIATMINDEGLRINKKFKINLSLLLVLFLIACLLSPNSYVWNKVNRESEFVTGYGNYVANGFVVKALADRDSTLFADRIDDLLYWTSEVTPAYKYSWYFAETEAKPFKSAYDEMFAKYPPTFYLGYCPKSTNQAIYLPKDQFKNYNQLLFAGKPTCMYIRSEKVKKLTEGQIKNLGNYQYSIK